MGICIQKTTFASSPKKSKLTKTNTSKQSFLYSSFTYDPSYINNQSNFFFFDLPHYCQIQYILRKANPEKQSQQFMHNIKQHIQQIQTVISNIQENGGIGNGFKSISMKKQTLNQMMQIQGQDISLQTQKSDNNNYQNSPQFYNFNNILNFQLVSVTFQQSDTSQNIQFNIYINQQKILSISGNLFQNKWKPLSTNQISIPNTIIQMQQMKKQIYIKIVTQLGNQTAQCTIPCNSMTFKYVIPVLQTINIRAKQDNQPLGHVHFRVQYVKNYLQHRKKVIKDLQIRKKGLQAILQRMKNREKGEVLDKFLIVDQNNSSFQSSFIQQ